MQLGPHSWVPHLADPSFYCMSRRSWDPCDPTGFGRGATVPGPSVHPSHRRGEDGGIGVTVGAGWHRWWHLGGYRGVGLSGTKLDQTETMTLRYHDRTCRGGGASVGSPPTIAATFAALKKDSMIYNTTRAPSVERSTHDVLRWWMMVASHL